MRSLISTSPGHDGLTGRGDEKEACPGARYSLASPSFWRRGSPVQSLENSLSRLEIENSTGNTLLTLKKLKSRPLVGAAVQSKVVAIALEECIAVDTTLASHPVQKGRRMEREAKQKTVMCLLSVEEIVDGALLT